MRESIEHKTGLDNSFNTFYSSLVSSRFYKLAMTAPQLKKRSCYCQHCPVCNRVLSLVIETTVFKLSPRSCSLFLPVNNPVEKLSFLALRLLKIGPKKPVLHCYRIKPSEKVVFFKILNDSSLHRCSSERTMTSLEHRNSNSP